MANYFSIEQYRFSLPFNDDSLHQHRMGENWPVVYLLCGGKNIYIGETSNAYRRMLQHGDPKGSRSDERGILNEVRIIFDPTFNKSAVLDIEQTLINMFHFEIVEAKGDKKSLLFEHLQNRNSGQSKMHNYYNRAKYQDKIKEIWGELKKLDIVQNAYDDIVNDNLFKFSPYKTLNEEQKRISIDIINKLMDSLENQQDYCAIIEGGAGTGKTIVLLNMMFKIVEAANINLEKFKVPDDFDEAEDYSEEIKLFQRIQKYITENKRKPKIAYVAQMKSLKTTISRVLDNSDLFNANDAKSPSDVVSDFYDTQEKFDILFIDEAHRLENWNYTFKKKHFKESCYKLYGEDVDYTQYTKLDWLIKCSKTTVIVYDKAQSVKRTDINESQFKKAISGVNFTDCFVLHSQMRCRSGEEYMVFLDNLFNCSLDTNKAPFHFDAYDIKIFDSAKELIARISSQDRKYRLCKVVTGPHWQWKPKVYIKLNTEYNQMVKKGLAQDSRAERLNFFLDNLHDNDGIVSIDGERYVRNLDYEWVIKGDPREIGCIHTSQGYDLNYVGIIFSPEIDYDDDQKKIVINRNLVEDHSVRVKNNDEMIDYIISSYKVMMNRGIRGCYLYACNPNLQDYLHQIFG